MNNVHFRSFCADRTMVEARSYIGHSQGERYTESVILDLEVLIEESSPRIPLIGLLSMGSDPTNEIEITAKRLEFRKF